MWSTRQRTDLLLSGLIIVILLYTTLRLINTWRSGFLLSYRTVFGFPDRQSMYPYTEENCQPPAEVILKPLNDQDFCPPTGFVQHNLTVTRRPTFILMPKYKDYGTEEISNRTTFMPDESQIRLPGEIRNSSEAQLSDIGFMAWGPKDSNNPSGWPRRFRKDLEAEEGCPVYKVPAIDADPVEFGPVKSFIPSLGGSQRGCRPIATRKVGFMFGFATSQSRTLKYLPRWYDWLNNTKTVEIETVMVLISPNENNSDTNWEIEMIGKALGFPLKIKSVSAKRYEWRYMRLVQHMWLEALKRESEGHHRTDWFTLADDDTFFLSLDSVNRMLSKYNPLEHHLIGASSESQQANNHFGRIAFGGAGIFLSRGLIQKMNAPGAFEGCFKDFGNEFGGDAMVTKCAIKLTSNATFKAEPTLHQLDIRDEAHGIFQAGLTFNTIHHWSSWFQLQPRSHPYTLKDPLALVGLLGKAARVVGAENWTRRYVWGFKNNTDPRLVASSGAVVVALGYSVTIFADSVLKQSFLDRIEHTFASEPVVMKTRPKLLETRQRRTYYLNSIRLVQGTGGRVAVMTHVNQEGELVDLVWDGRRRPHEDDD
ncbi:hypothetical protein MJO28_011049 [Puccinia striiformis f. sp. tritici]|uniref:Uncharacterized protein n=1 Tax=Puccinia striiformis f. sp. tritici TaxID=168172 RepID=A0ACC0E2E1_9BASI|nr:hypothetical protein MJO28_011049 [Puccinia striiformis f. sp. tritici]KAI7946280.1 hypothetical protein MJO29_010807 [Puccinia striiformis f. sp. tritici]